MAAIVASAFALAGFLVGLFYQGLASTLPPALAIHVQVLANESYLIGGVALAIAVIIWVLIVINESR